MPTIAEVKLYGEGGDGSRGTGESGVSFGRVDDKGRARIEEGDGGGAKNVQERNEM